jgi:uncharacterized protein (TIGR00251 family)
MEPSASVRLRVSPGARRSEIVGRYGDGWKVRVTAPPDDGRANEAVLGLLAETLDLPRRSLSLVSGHGGRDKVVRMAGISESELERKLQQ